MGIDFGEKRIGMALGDDDLKMAQPLSTWMGAKGEFLGELRSLVAEHGVAGLVVGLPRGLEGQETAQTRLVLEFVSVLRSTLSQPVAVQDEALTSEVALERLKQRGEAIVPGAVDREAARIILQDYLDSL